MTTKQRKPAAPKQAPANTLGDALAASAAPAAATPAAAPAAAAGALYGLGKGFKPRTDHGYGGKGKNPQATAWESVVKALPATQADLVAVVRKVAQLDGSLVAHGPGYPASFVNKRIRSGALVAVQPQS
jgi:hypothetical protein